MLRPSAHDTARAPKSLRDRPGRIHKGSEGATIVTHLVKRWVNSTHSIDEVPQDQKRQIP